MWICWCIRDLLPLLCLAFHTDIRVRSYVQEICCAVFWNHSLTSYDSVKSSVLGRIKSYFSVLCLVFDDHNTEEVAIRGQYSKIEWILKGRNALKEAGSLLDLCKQCPSCKASLDGASMKTLEALFRPLSLLESNPESCSSIEASTYLRLLIHCVRDSGSDAESNTGIESAILHHLKPIISSKNNSSRFLWLDVLNTLLQSTPMDQVSC